MREIGVIALGGAAGSLCRYAVGLAAERLPGGFPWNTLIVNVFGCFLMGIVMCLGSRQVVLSQLAVQGIAVGFLGGLTTFSAFSHQTLALLRAGAATPAFMNIAANVLLSLAATWAGWSLTEKLAPLPIDPVPATGVEDLT